MLLYHGSDHIVGKPIYGKGKPYNDYGLGFYCTKERNMAAEWAVDFHQDGFINAYEIDEKGLSILNLESPEYTMLHWLEILIRNRSFDLNTPLSMAAYEYLTGYFHTDETAADLVIGYRADDSYFTFAKDFLNGAISYRQLTDAMHLGKLGIQVVLKSPAAFSRITETGYERVKCSDWYHQKLNRDQHARDNYFDTKRNKWVKGDLYITRILEEEVRPDDPRLR